MRVRGILFDKDDTLTDLADFLVVPLQKFAEETVRKYVGTERPYGRGCCPASGAERSYGRGCCPASGAERPAVRMRQLEEQILERIGIREGRVIPESILVAGTNEDIVRVTRRTLEEAGIRVPENFEEQALARIRQLSMEYGTVRGLADPELFAGLKARGIHLGVATSDDYEVALHCLKSAHIDRYFDVILSADRVPRPKPAPETAEIFCRDYRLDPSEVLMVGDSENDMRFAANSGIVGVYFSDRADEALPRGARYRISDLAEVARIAE